MASPNTHQYTDANGKLRWRSSSKTTEELLEEERQRRAAQEAQTASTQSQLGTMAGNLAPVNNTSTPQVPASPITETEPLLNNASMQAMCGLINKAKEKFQNPQSNGTLSDSINDVVFSERPLDKESIILKALENELGQNPLSSSETEPNYLEENILPLTEEEMPDINELLGQQELPEASYYQDDQPENLIKGGITKEAGGESIINNPNIFQRSVKGTEKPISGKSSSYPFELNDSGEVVLKGAVNKDNKERVMDKLNRYAIVKKSDISAKMNSDGSMTIWQPDFYDFSYVDPGKEPNRINKEITRINNRAYNQQELNQLKKYSLAIILTLSPEDIQELQERERKRKNNK